MKNRCIRFTKISVYAFNKYFLSIFWNQFFTSIFYDFLRRLSIFYVNKPLQYERKVIKFYSAAANGLATGAFQKCNWSQIEPMLDRGLIWTTVRCLPLGYKWLAEEHNKQAWRFVLLTTPIVLSSKQEICEYHFLKSFGMTQLGK